MRSARQGDHEGSVRVGPGGDEEGDLPPTVGEVDVNVTEVGLEALAGEMPQGDEGLTVRAVVLAEIAPHLAVTAVVSVLVTEAAKDLRWRYAAAWGEHPRRRPGFGR